MECRPVSIILAIIAIALLLIGIPKGLAYDYYIFLRWAVTTIAAYLAYRSFHTDNQPWGWVLVVIAIVFNPIVPIYLSKGTWVIIDLIAALLIGTSVFVLKEQEDEGK